MPNDFASRDRCSSIGPEAKWENVAAMIDEAHRVGRYPLDDALVSDQA